MHADRRLSCKMTCGYRHRAWWLHSERVARAERIGSLSGNKGRRLGRGIEDLRIVVRVRCRGNETGGLVHGHRVSCG